MRIRWTIPAAEDLESIKMYLEEHYPHFAEPTVRRIYESIRSLRASPNRGAWLSLTFRANIDETIIAGDCVFYVPDPKVKKVTVYCAGPHPNSASIPPK